MIATASEMTAQTPARKKEKNNVRFSLVTIFSSCIFTETIFFTSAVDIPIPPSNPPASKQFPSSQKYAYIGDIIRKTFA